MKPDRLRVMHLVDSLALGGTESMAVHLVNTLPRDRFAPSLCTTRAEGPLAQRIVPDVQRFQLRRRGRFGLGGILRLACIIRREGVQVVHAHSTAAFTAAAALRFCPGVRLLWHDHYGLQNERERPVRPYRTMARFLDGVIAVNSALAEWARVRLRVPAGRVWYIPNFVSPPPAEPPAADVPGQAGRRMVQVANFRPQKDHLTALSAMAIVAREVPDAHLALVGSPVDADCAGRVRQEIGRLGVERNVTILGERNDVPAVLRGCDIGTLSSASEGLPLSLIEYGMAGLPAVVTDVGQCAEVLDGGQAGLLVPPGDPVALAGGMLRLLRNAELRTTLGEALRSRISAAYSPAAALGRVGDIYAALCHKH